MSITWFNGATLALSIDMVHGALSTPTSFTDFSSLLRGGITITRGRSSERDTFNVGTMTFTLDNRNRDFDPEYAAGSYFGNVLPMRHCRLRLTYNATTYDLFYGYVQGWPQSWETSDNDSVVTIVAHDALKLGGMALLPESEWSLNATPSAATWYRLGEESGAALCADSAAITPSFGNYGTDGQVRGDSLIAHSNNGSRTVTSTGSNSTAKVAYNLTTPGTTSGFALEFWVRTPTAATGFTSWLWMQYDTDFWYSGGGVGEAIPNATTTPYMMVGIDSSLFRFKYEMHDGTNLGTGYCSFPSTLFDGGVHQLVIDRNTSSMSLYIDGVSQAMTLGGTVSGGSVTYGAHGQIGPFHEGTWTVDEVGVFTGHISAAQVTSRYGIGTTPGNGETVDARITRVKTASSYTTLGTSLDASTVTVQAADYGNGATNVLAYLQTLEATEHGRIFVDSSGILTFHSRYHDITSTVQAAFTDAAGGTLPYAEAIHEFDDTRIINTATVTRNNGASQTATDSTSRGKYGRRTGGQSAALYTSDVYSTSDANATLARYKDPAPRILSLGVKPRTNPTTLFPQVGGLDIGDKVTFRRAPMGGTAYTKRLVVEGVSHQITMNGEWMTTYLTSPVDFTEGFWVLGDATYGILGTARVGY